MNTTTQLQDEIFCLNFELKTLSSIITAHKLERWLPGFTDPVTDFDHRQRYNWVSQFIKDKRVMDIACGTGYGSYMMATEGGAKYVAGCDIEQDAVTYAGIKHKAANLSYEVQDATTIQKNELFDVVVSFETVEHIRNTKAYLEALHRHLTDDGIFIVSTPISAKDEDLTPKNIYHVIEWGFKRFQEVVSQTFDIREVYLQLHDERPYGFVERRMNRFFPKPFNYQNTKIEKFSAQVPVHKLGKQRNGYQILVCTKRRA